MKRSLHKPATQLKAVLSGEELPELSDGTEDQLAVQMVNRSAGSGIAYVTLTATPKAKTLELFGSHSNPDLLANTGNLKPGKNQAIIGNRWRYGES